MLPLSLSVTYISNGFPKIRNTSSIFSVITVSIFLSPDESRAIPSHVLFGIFPEITGRDQRFFASIPHIQKKTAFVFHFHEKSAFCSRIEAAIHRCFTWQESKRVLTFLHPHSIQVFGGCGKLFQTDLPEKTVLRHFRHLCIQVFRSSVRWLP